MSKELSHISSINKPKIPKEYAYVLQSSQLNKLLLDSNFSIHTDLLFWLPQIIGSIFEVHYWLPNENNPYCRLHIRAGALKIEYVKAAKEVMNSTILPQFAIWLRDIIKLPNSSPILNKDLYFNAVFKDGKLEISF